jgi:cytoskeleton protein RodZ
MKKLGEFLRAERQARGISLEQISADTRISLTMLQAIEDGSVKDLAAPVLVKGFLKSYAQRIGLDPEEIIIGYQDGIEQLGVNREVMERFHQRLYPRATRTKIYALLAVLGLLAGVTLIWLNYSHTRKESNASLNGKIASSLEKIVSGGKVNRKLPAIVSRRAQKKSGPETESRTPPLTAELTADASSDMEVSRIGDTVSSTENFPRHVGQPSSGSPSFVLRAEAVETTWLRVLIDGSQAHEYTLQPGEQLTWTAATGIHLLVGNAGGIRLYANDAPLKLLGESGKVIRLYLPDPSLVASTDNRQNNSRNGQ